MTPLILCIDDRVAHAEIRAILLRQFGCEVVIKDDPAQAFAELAARPFDLVLIDYHLAFGVMGDAVAREIRAQWPKLPLVMLTGDAGITAEAREAVDAVLIKGASNPADLWETIQELLPEGKNLKPRRPPVVRLIPPKVS